MTNCIRAPSRQQTSFWCFDNQLLVLVLVLILLSDICRRDYESIQHLLIATRSNCSIRVARRRDLIMLTTRQLLLMRRTRWLSSGWRSLSYTCTFVDNASATSITPGVSSLCKRAFHITSTARQQSQQTRKQASASPPTASASTSAIPSQIQSKRSTKIPSIVTGKIASPPPRTFSSVTADDREELLRRVGDLPQTSVSLQALMSTGRGEFLHKTFAEDTVERHTATALVLRQVALFLQRELPIRLAHRVRDLDAVPWLSDMDSVRGVRDLYIQSGCEILRFADEHPAEMQNDTTEEAFARLVEGVYERHANVLVQMARGAFEFRKTLQQGGNDDNFVLQNQIHAFLDRFYMSRIGIRVLIGQYLALRQPPVENYIGIICSHTSPYEIVKRAIDDAAFMCTRKYGDAPEVIMTGRLDLTFPYVPTHLRKFCVWAFRPVYALFSVRRTSHFFCGVLTRMS